MKIEKHDIAAIILAAGRSSRFGAPKILQHYSGRSFLQHILSGLKAAEIAPVHLILGFHAEEIQAALAGIEEIRIAVNPQPERGQFSSLQEGIRALPAGLSGVLVCLSDQPHLQPSVYRAIARAARSHTENIIIPVYGERGGHPIYLPRFLFAPILSASPSATLRDILAHYREHILRLPLSDSGILHDIDTRADLDQLENKNGKNR